MQNEWVFCVGSWVSRRTKQTALIFILQDYLGSLVEVLRASDSDDLKVEVLGILGNVSIPDLDYAKVVKDLALLPLLADYLKVEQYREYCWLMCVCVLFTLGCCC